MSQKSSLSQPTQSCLLRADGGHYRSLNCIGIISLAVSFSAPILHVDDIIEARRHRALGTCASRRERVLDEPNLSHASVDDLRQRRRGAGQIEGFTIVSRSNRMTADTQRRGVERGDDPNQRNRAERRGATLEVPVGFPGLTLQ
jgi:hypothetical protein